MKIKLTSVMVNDQSRALSFYTEKLGFIKKTDSPVGEYRWLTVISPEGHDDVELLLEPIGKAAAKTFQEFLFKEGIPATVFFVHKLNEEYERLKNAGVNFTAPPTKAEWGKSAILDDTCGNLIMIMEG